MMKIERFCPDMQDAVNEFFGKCFAHVGIPFSPADRHADIANVEQYYMQNGSFWCLFTEQALVGTVALRTIDRESKVTELKRMFVLPEYQGKGYGRLLLNHAIESARKSGYRKICLDTRKQFSVAQHLYQSAGFQETEKYNDNERAELYFELIL